MLKIIKKYRSLKGAIIISTAIHIILIVITLWRTLGNDNRNTLKFAKQEVAIDAKMMDLETIVKNSKYQKYQPKEEKDFIEKEKKQEKRKKKEVPKKIRNKENKTKKTLKTTNYLTKIRKKKDDIKTSKEAVVEDSESFFKSLISRKFEKKRKNDSKNTRKYVNTLTTENSNTQNVNELNIDIANYADQIKSAIENQFYNASYYSGKTCTLRIQLAPDGTMIDIYPEGGDPSLCRAALSAVRHAKIPIPPSESVYEFFKNALLDFRP